MSELTIVRLTRDPAWLAYRRRLEDLGLLAPSLPLANETWQAISVGGQAKISRAMILMLFGEGWRGLEHIPPDCVA